jgi:hypothetical protein
VPTSQRTSSSPSRLALADIERKGSRETGYRNAKRELDRAQAKLDKAVSALEGAGLGDEPSAIGTLTALREAREELAERVEQLAQSKATGILHADRDWDQLTLEEKRELIAAVIKSANGTTGARYSSRADRDRAVLSSLFYRWPVVVNAQDYRRLSRWSVFTQLLAADGVQSAQSVVKIDLSIKRGIEPATREPGPRTKG